MRNKVVEYINYILENRKNIEFLEKPKTVRCTFKAKCNISGEVFNPSLFSLVKQNTCCKQCGINKVIKSKTEKARDKFISQLNTKLKHIQVIGEYKTKKTKLSFTALNMMSIFTKLQMMFYGVVDVNIVEKSMYLN